MLARRSGDGAAARLPVVARELGRRKRRTTVLEEACAFTGVVSKAGAAAAALPAEVADTAGKAELAAVAVMPKRGSRVRQAASAPLLAGDTAAAAFPADLVEARAAAAAVAVLPRKRSRPRQAVAVPTLADIVAAAVPPETAIIVVEAEAAAAVAVPKKRSRPRQAAAVASLADADLPALRSKAQRIYETLAKLYIDPPCPLDHESTFQLLVSVILSAQTTDKKVNEVTPALFAVGKDAASMAALEVGVIEGHIRTVGLAPTKARNLRMMSQMLMDRHGGEVPSSFEELEALPGVGHKTASVVLAIAFRLPTFPVDTHIHRLAQRWGLTNGRTVEQTEADLKLLWPEAHWNALHLRLIYFGREHCPAPRHDPSACRICAWAAVPPYDRPGASPLKAGAPRAPGRKAAAVVARTAT